MWIDPEPCSLCEPVGPGGCAPASAAAGWHAAPTAIRSAPGLPTTLPAQTGHCSQPSFCFPAKSMLISGFFSLSLLCLSY